VLSWHTPATATPQSWPVPRPDLTSSSPRLLQACPAPVRARVSRWHWHRDSYLFHLIISNTIHRDTTRRVLRHADGPNLPTSRFMSRLVRLSRSLLTYLLPRAYPLVDCRPYFVDSGEMFAPPTLQIQTFACCIVCSC
jgi:hypothetical protein